MGLDMYLDARKYVSKYDYSEGHDKKKLDPSYAAISAVAPAGYDKYADFGSITVSYPVGYWRKANAIHGWFVRELAGGEDNCQEIDVPREKLEELLEKCKAVASVHAGSVEEAASDNGLYPVQGFFFGSYEIDEWYMQDMKYTIEMLEHVLEVIPNDSWEWSFVYRASW